MQWQSILKEFAISQKMRRQKIPNINLFSWEFDWVWPPVVDDCGQADHEDQGVKAQHPDGVPLLNNPGRKSNTKLHGLGTVGIAIVLPVVPVSLKYFF